MDRIFDLPAHPLIVHFPVVAVPALALLAFVIAVWPSFRARYGHATVALSVVTTVSAFLATRSGKSLSEDTQELIGLPASWIEDHETLGDQTALLMVALLVVLLVLVYVVPRVDLRAMTLGTSALVVLLAVLSTVWVVRTGHSGAKAHWGGFYPAEEESGG